jgi:hypothetical protein
LGCVALTSVIIPSSVTAIGNYAFYGCVKLDSITVSRPQSSEITSLGVEAFANCDLLEYIYVPFDSVDAYKTALNWNSYESKITTISD